MNSLRLDLPDSGEQPLSSCRKSILIDVSQQTFINHGHMFQQRHHRPQRVLELLFLSLQQTVERVGMADAADKLKMRSILILDLRKDAGTVRTSNERRLSISFGARHEILTSRRAVIQMCPASSLPP